MTIKSHLGKTTKSQWKIAWFLVGVKQYKPVMFSYIVLIIKVCFKIQRLFHILRTTDNDFKKTFQVTSFKQSAFKTAQWRHHFLQY